MFNDEVFLKSQRPYLTSLHAHLSRKPMLGRYLKRIRCDMPLDRNADLVEKILNLVVHPNTIAIAGMCDRDIYNDIYKMAEDGPLKEHKLQMVPRSYDYEEEQIKFVLDFKDTLKHADIHISYVIPVPSVDVICDRLDEFKQLTSLSLLKYLLDGIMGLDTLLQKVPKLQSLVLTVNFAQDDHISMEQGDMVQWLRDSNIQQNETLKSLRMCGEMKSGYHDDVFEYMLFKYPKLEVLTLSGLGSDFDLPRLLNNIQHILVVDIMSYFPEDNDPAGMLDIIQHMKSPTANSIAIEFKADFRRPRLSAKRYSTQVSKFILTLPPSAVGIDYIQLLSSFEADRVIHLSVDLLDQREWESDEIKEPIQSICGALEAVTQVESVHFTDMAIALEDFQESTIFNNLDRLEISNAVLDPDLLPQISNRAPNLTTLDLNYCVVGGYDQDQQGSFDVIMPNSSLEMLNFTESIVKKTYEENSASLQRQLIRQKWETYDAKAVFLQIETKFNSNYKCRYLMAMHGKPVLSLSETDFRVKSQGSLTLHIECKSLKMLLIHRSSVFLCLCINESNETVGAYLANE